MKYYFIVLALGLCLVLPSAYAFWMESIWVDGTLTATGGSNSAPETYSMSVNIDSDSNYTHTMTYNLKDDESNLIFYMNDSINSTNSSCMYDKGYDLNFFVSANGKTVYLNDTASDPLTFFSGTNSWSVIIQPRPDRCPLSGSFEIWSVFV